MQIQMHWFSFALGGLAVGSVVTIVAIMFIVIGGFTRKGEHESRWSEMWRQMAGRRWKDAEPRQEARRQVLIKQHMAVIERREGEQVGVQR